MGVSGDMQMMEPPMINTEAFADTTNVSMPVDANVLQFVTTGGSPASLKTLNQRGLDYIE